MISTGIHPSVVVDIRGTAELPPTTILEPLTAIFVGQSGRLSLGERNILYPQCSIRIDRGWMTTGSDVSFGPGCHIYEPRGGLTIGDNCLIAGGALICGVTHGSEKLDIPMRQQAATAAPIVIEDDVWIGMRVVVMPGVTIGRSSIIGAGSVVTRDIPAFSVAFGAPCRVQKDRRTHA